MIGLGDGSGVKVKLKENRGVIFVEGGDIKVRDGGRPGNSGKKIQWDSNVVDPVGCVVSRMTPCVRLIFVDGESGWQCQVVVSKERVEKVAIVALLFRVKVANVWGDGGACFGIEVSCYKEGDVG